MIACPSCNRRVFIPRDILYATLDGTAQCRACSRTARLGIASRWMISCVIAILLPAVLLYGDVFYSGHLILISTFLILGAWRLLSFVAFPFLSLEVVARSRSIDRAESILILVVLLIAAIVLDGFISSRFDSDNVLENARSPSAVHHDR